jgi:hypothetical protein
MTSIPIYDPTVPVACTAGREELPLRKDQLGRLRELGPEIERTDHGLLLHFPDGPEVDAEVDGFTVAEKACCAFWGFEVTRLADRLTLRWDGPPEVAAILDQVAAFFAGEAPLDSLDGLL